MTLAAALFDLYRMGKVQLPNLSAQFFLAEGYLQGANRISPFERGSGVGGDSGVGAAFQSLANALDDVLEKEAKNLAEMGTALIRVADDYAHTDAAAAAEFDGLVKNQGW
jgi:hypothetical protein